MKWTNNELYTLNHELYEVVRNNEDISNNKMYEAVKERICTILTRRHIDDYEKKCESKRKEINERHYEQLIINGSRVTRLKENKITTG
jgi:hypothetical protein